MTVYMFNLSFTHYKNSYIQAHKQVFHSNYLSFLHMTMTEVLLNKIYQNVKAKVNSLLIVSHLNFLNMQYSKEKSYKFMCTHVKNDYINER